MKNAAALLMQRHFCKPRKPDSVSKLSFICSCHYWQDVAAYPGSLDEQPSSEPIHGITALKVYPCSALLQNIVSSYLTFSPSRFKQSQLFSVALSMCC